MAIVIDRKGEALHWEPTTELLCSYCLEAFPVERQSWGKVNFMFDAGVPEPLADGEYWYFHKRCSHITNHLQVRWGWLSVPRILGFTYDGKKRSPNKIQKDIQQRMPQTAYERLYNNWRPAFPHQARTRHAPSRLTPIPTPIVPTTQQPKVVSVQERPGYVYLLQADGTNRIKIGRSQNRVVRIETLQTASPFPLVTLRVIPATDAVALETALHQRYHPYKAYREWYVLPANMLTALLQEDFT